MLVPVGICCPTPFTRCPNLLALEHFPTSFVSGFLIIFICHYLSCIWIENGVNQQRERRIHDVFVRIVVRNWSKGSVCGKGKRFGHNFIRLIDFKVLCNIINLQTWSKIVSWLWLMGNIGIVCRLSRGHPWFWYVVAWHPWFFNGVLSVSETGQHSVLREKIQIKHHCKDISRLRERLYLLIS